MTWKQGLYVVLLIAVIIGIMAYRPEKIKIIEVHVSHEVLPSPRVIDPSPPDTEMQRRIKFFRDLRLNQLQIQNANDFFINEVRDPFVRMR